GGGAEKRRRAPPPPPRRRGASANAPAGPRTTTVHAGSKEPQSLAPLGHGYDDSDGGMTMAGDLGSGRSRSSRSRRSARQAKSDRLGFSSDVDRNGNCDQESIRGDIAIIR